MENPTVEADLENRTEKAEVPKAENRTGKTNVLIWVKGTDGKVVRNTRTGLSNSVRFPNVELHKVQYIIGCGPHWALVPVDRAGATQTVGYTFSLEL